MSDLQECSKREFFKPGPNGHDGLPARYGACRRKPPRIISISSASGDGYSCTEWPCVNRTDWCGEFVAGEKDQ